MKPLILVDEDSNFHGLVSELGIMFCIFGGKVYHVQSLYQRFDVTKTTNDAKRKPKNHKMA